MSWPLVGIFVILAIGALKIGSTLVLPIVVSALFALLLGGPVRWLRRHGVKESIGAGLVVFGAVALLGLGIYFLSAPAAEWLQKAPQSLSQAERKLRKLVKPFETIQQTAEKVERVTTPDASNGTQKVEIAQPGLLKRAQGTSIALAGGVLTVVFLTYFLLATGELFRHKLAAVLPSRRERARVADALAEIELQMSRYLFLTTVINAVVGLLTWGVLALIGMPNAALWGAVAGVLNFIPYIGAIVTLGLIGAAGLVSFDAPKMAFVAAGAFLVINMIESNLVTPAVLGKKLPLNVVALFVGLLFWGWIWGVTGAVLAVPLTVMMKIICDHVEGLEKVGVFLDS